MNALNDYVFGDMDKVPDRKLEDNRPIEDSTRHDDIWAAMIAMDRMLEKYAFNKSDDENLEILETACKTALVEIEKIKGTKYD